MPDCQQPRYAHLSGSIDSSKCVRLRRCLATAATISSVSKGGAGDGLARLAAAKDRWLHQVRGQFAADERIVAAWLSGSMGRGVGDEWADLDIHLVVTDYSSEQVLAVPADAEALGDLLMWVD